MSSIDNIIKKLREGRTLNERKDYTAYSREELIALAQEGDRLAIDTLISTHQDFLGKMSYKYILRDSDKEDVKQLATIAFWDAIKSYNPDTSGDFEAYAGMLIKRKLTDELRKESAEKRQINNLATSLEDTLSGDDEGGEDTLGNSTASKDLSPEEQYLGREGARELMAFMRDKFSEREREVVMRHIKGDKISQIAEETGMSYKSVENTLMRIKNKLTDYLKKSYRESKRIRREKDIKFSDEEKKILESVITKINEHESLRESRVVKLKESYDEYTGEQIDSELEDIEFGIDDIRVNIAQSEDGEEMDDNLGALEELRDKLYALEEYLTDEQYQKSEDLHSEILKAIESAEDKAAAGPKEDPYHSRGLRRSDFY